MPSITRAAMAQFCQGAAGYPASMTGRSGRMRIRRLLDLPGAVAGVSLDAMRLGWRARNGRMPDVLTVYAQMQPEKIAVIDDRPDGTVTSLTYAELEQR